MTAGRFALYFSLQVDSVSDEKPVALCFNMKGFFKAAAMTPHFKRLAFHFPAKAAVVLCSVGN